MTKSDLIDALASDTGLSKADSDRFLKSFTSNVEDSLAKLEPFSDFSDNDSFHETDLLSLLLLSSTFFP